MLSERENAKAKKLAWMEVFKVNLFTHFNVCH